MINFPLSLVYLESVDSTNSYLKRLIKAGELSTNTCVIAAEQTQGRGRLGRTWQSRRGNTLCMSIALKTPVIEGFTLLVALALCKALEPFFSKSILQIKWPNDIVAGNKKLCGILCERVLEYTVIGIGINVNDKSFEGDIENKATSLFLLSGKENDISAVAETVISAFESTLLKYGLAFNEEAKSDYEKLCVNLGREVITQNFSGVAVAVSKDGSLLLETKKGVQAVSSGEVAVHGIY